jgi:hypothetical protein
MISDVEEYLPLKRCVCFTSPITSMEYLPAVSLNVRSSWAGVSNLDWDPIVCF